MRLPACVRVHVRAVLLCWRMGVLCTSNCLLQYFVPLSLMRLFISVLMFITQKCSIRRNVQVLRSPPVAMNVISSHPL